MPRKTYTLICARYTCGYVTHIQAGSSPEAKVKAGPCPKCGNAQSNWKVQG